ncbi:MAG: MFS transporter [Actinomycetota bacterium]|nr:MFS transporter [Actinomycetota bacterium]
MREAAIDGAAGESGVARQAFAQGAGPLAAYRRTVEVGPAAGGLVAVRQEVEFEVGLPWWSWLFASLLRAHLGSAKPAEAKMPWWGPPQRVERRSAVVLATLAALVAVQGLVAGVFPETLTYASSQMHAGTFAQGAVFAAVELSALPALGALVMADRRGRRSVLLWATGAAVLSSALGAVVPSVAWLALTQVVAGALVAAAGIAAVVMAVEEVPDGCRAWSVGVLGMAGGLGAGVPLALLPLAGTGPGGWRWLYALSLLCLPVVARSARHLPESHRWAQAERRRLRATAPGGPPERSVLAQLGLAGAGGRTLALVCAGAALFALFAVPAVQFQTQFLRDQRHYSALAISVLEQLSGTLGGLGVLAGGRLADTRGRRPVGIVCVTGATLSTLAAYLTHAWFMWASATASQFFLYAMAPVLGVYGAELFATKARARSAGLVSAASSAGAVIGLLSMGWFAARMGNLTPALALLAAGPVGLVLLLVLAFPESAGASLEDLAGATTGPVRAPNSLVTSELDRQLS